MLPGPGRLHFENFKMSQQTIIDVKDNIGHDLDEILNETDVNDPEETAIAARQELVVARRKPNLLTPETSPLTWWPQQASKLAIIYPVAAMLLAIPASSAD